MFDGKDMLASGTMTKLRLIQRRSIIL